MQRRGLKVRWNIIVEKLPYGTFHRSICQNSIHHLIYIGLGSNLEQPVNQVKKARIAINRLEKVQEVAFSSLYQSSPMGPKHQPDYINAVMAVNTSLKPIDMLRCLQQIENQQGRMRNDQRWTARTLDLDMLLYGDQQIDIPDLLVPLMVLLIERLCCIPSMRLNQNLISQDLDIFLI